MKTFTKSHLAALPKDHSDRLDSLCANGGQFVMEEIWKDIDGYNGDYQVSTFGRVKSFKRNVVAILKGSRDGWGYPQASLNNRHIKIHRLVANAFIPNPENKRTVNHKNGVKHDNRVENLEWATDTENSLHSTIILGKKKVGNKLNWEKVVEIRERLSNGERQSKLLKEYGISVSTMSKINTGEIWKHDNGRVMNENHVRPKSRTLHCQKCLENNIRQIPIVIRYEISGMTQLKCQKCDHVWLSYSTSAQKMGKQWLKAETQKP